jgi:hypothetical protein
MLKQPTALSRSMSYIAVLCVVGMYLIYGWFSPSIPDYVAVILGGIAVGSVLAARYFREQYGTKLQVREHARAQFRRLANVAVCFALVSMASALASLTAVQLGLSKSQVRPIFVVSMGIFALNAVVNIVIDFKTKPLLE